MRLIVFRTDSNGIERRTEVRVPEPFDEARLVVVTDGQETDLGTISVIDPTWEPRG